MLKKFGILSLILLTLCLQTTAFAAVPQMAETMETVYFADGSYLQVTIVTEEYQTYLLGRTASKKYDYYTSDDKIVVSYTLTASFEYDGKTSSATDVTASAAIYQSGWSLKSHKEYCSGNRAYGTAAFSGPSGSKTLGGFIACDKNGNIT